MPESIAKAIIKNPSKIFSLFMPPGAGGAMRVHGSSEPPRSSNNVILDLKSAIKYLDKTIDCIETILKLKLIQNADVLYTQTWNSVTQTKANFAVQEVRRVGPKSQAYFEHCGIREKYMPSASTDNESQAALRKFMSFDFESIPKVPKQDEMQALAEKVKVFREGRNFAESVLVELCGTEQVAIPPTPTTTRGHTPKGKSAEEYRRTWGRSVDLHRTRSGTG